MYGSQLVAITQIVTVMLCTAVAFGILLSTMLVRGRLHALGSEGPLHDSPSRRRPMSPPPPSARWALWPP